MSIGGILLSTGRYWAGAQPLGPWYVGECKNVH
jgi:hypothetical protein